MSLTLHGYWRSGAAYRTRVALALKGLEYAQVAHDLRQGAQRGADYLALNPQGLIPALETDDGVLTQSPAILEWLEERYPQPPLLPAGSGERAIVRAMGATIGCDIHPLGNLRVLNALRDDFGADSQAVKAWIGKWIVAGFSALEVSVQRHGRGFMFGDTPTLADCYLVPQIYAAERFDVDLTLFPTLLAAAANTTAIEAVARAHPDLQSDKS